MRLGGGVESGEVGGKEGLGTTACVKAFCILVQGSVMDFTSSTAAE